MFLRLLWESFVRQRRRKALAGIAILLGTTAVTAMLTLATTIGDRIHKELAVYGANIVVTPKAEQLAVKVGGIDIKPTTGGAYLKESDLNNLKTIFWANNITGISPELSFSGQASSPALGTQFIPVNVHGFWFNQKFGERTTGASQLNPSWQLQGRWPTDGHLEVAIGQNLAQRLNVKVDDYFRFMQAWDRVSHVTGIVSTGTELDNDVFITLHSAQGLSSLPDAISRVEISARTKPEDAFARRDPATLSKKDYDVWYCRPYANSIALQIREAIPGSDAQQVRQIEQSEGTILTRISGLMWLISIAALLAASFAVSAAMATAILERRGEIGLMRSLGASRAAIALLFYSETGLLAIIAGTLGYLFGSALAAWLGAGIFTDATSQAATLPHLTAAQIFNPVLLPVVVATALIVAIAGSTPSIRTALRMDPSTVLRADA
jgi:putative ABC transport system permease protein